MCTAVAAVMELRMYSQRCYVRVLRTVSTAAHGWALFDFLAKVRGNDSATSVNFRGCCHGLTWESAGFHDKGPRSWPFHGKCLGCDHGTYGGSVRGTLHLPTMATNGRPRQLSRQYNFHGNAAITTKARGNHHGSPRQLPRRLPWTSNRSNFHGYPWPSAAIATATLR